MGFKNPDPPIHAAAAPVYLLGVVCLPLQLRLAHPCAQGCFPLLLLLLLHLPHPGLQGLALLPLLNCARDLKGGSSNKGGGGGGRGGKVQAALQQVQGARGRAVWRQWGNIYNVSLLTNININNKVLI